MEQEKVCHQRRSLYSKFSIDQEMVVIQLVHVRLHCSSLCCGMNAHLDDINQKSLSSVLCIQGHCPAYNFYRKGFWMNCSDKHRVGINHVCPLHKLAMLCWLMGAFTTWNIRSGKNTKSKEVHVYTLSRWIDRMEWEFPFRFYQQRKTSLHSFPQILSQLVFTSALVINRESAI